MAPGLFACVIAGLAAALPARADERGPVTNLPLPRFVSMKAAEANVRRGPSLTHRIDWVFKHEDTPLEITAEHGHWRRPILRLLLQLAMGTREELGQRFLHVRQHRRGSPSAQVHDGMEGPPRFR